MRRPERAAPASSRQPTRLITRSTFGRSAVGFPSQRGDILLRERSSPMAGETRRKFDHDFREGAVRLVRETGKPVAQVARDLGSTKAPWATGSTPTSAAAATER